MAKLKELMDRISKLSEVLDINLDCTGINQHKISKYIKRTAKKFLSTMHGRTRNELRRGAQIVQKAGPYAVRCPDKMVKEVTLQVHFLYQSSTSSRLLTLVTLSNTLCLMF